MAAGEDAPPGTTTGRTTSGVEHSLDDPAVAEQLLLVTETRLPNAVTHWSSSRLCSLSRTALLAGRGRAAPIRAGSR